MANVSNVPMFLVVPNMRPMENANYANMVTSFFIIGYKLSEYQTCDYVQTPNSDCCSLFDDDGNCIQCAPGLYLEKNSCFEIVRPGCLEGEGNICDNCAAEYNLIHGKCKKKIEWCSVYDEDGIC